MKNCGNISGLNVDTVNSEIFKNITLGAVRIEENDGWISFHRFGSDMEKSISERRSVIASRVTCTANIKLEFYTKGGEVSFDFKVTPGTNREYYSIDIAVDDAYKYNISKNVSEDEDTFSYYIKESDEEKRVTIYFPSTACVKIKNLKLPSDFKPHQRKRKILVLGASGYQGYHPDHFQNTSMNIVADFYDADMINQGIGGERFNKENIERLDFNPDIIIVGFGINDWVSGKFKNGEDAREYLEKLTELYRDCPVFLVLPQEMEWLEKTRKNDDLLYKADNENSQTLQDVRDILFEISKDFKNIITINSKNFTQNYPGFFFDDNVHFTDFGNTRFALSFIKELGKYYK